MIQLKSKIELNKNYINYGNNFSKLLFLRDKLQNLDSFLMVVENEKSINSYLKIADFLGIKLSKLASLSDLINITYNSKGKYIVTREVYNLELEKFSQLEYKDILTINKGETILTSDLTKTLNEFEFSFSEYNNKGCFNLNGDVFSFTDNNENILKVSFWGDDIEDILYNNKQLESFTFGRNKLLDFNNISKKTNTEIIDKINDSDSLIILDSLDFYSSYEDIIKGLDLYIIFNSLANNNDYVNLGISDLFLEKIDDFKSCIEEKGLKKYVFTKNAKTINNFIELNNLSGVEVHETSINTLKSFRTANELVIADDNISRIFVKKRIKRSLSKNLDLMMQIKPGDHIVHIDHGIGVFKEIVEKELGGIKKEYITLEYKNDDKLFVPITEVARVSKYVGSENPKLTPLSTKEWEKKIKKVSEDVEIIAGELLELFAKRRLNKGHSFLSLPSEEAKFANSFEYVYTEDQLNVIGDIYKDMESDIAMDRLLSGDVGFGKTEIAFASIFKALANEKQAALISPLVVLAYEHYEKARERFKSFPFNIGVLTRFEKPAAIKATLEKLKQGKIDLIVGTHRLLSEDIQFKDLGLLVVDEEHKFGVKDKEKIKKFKGDIDILSMSATPIPRSLNMALNGIKQVSMLTTPPVGRQPIQTIVSGFEDSVILQAGKREFERGGQLFFIHNRVETISGVGKYLEKIFPGKKIAIAHGQLSGDILEKRIIDFKRKNYDILLATTVVENGIDFSNVNTIFINEAQNFGISQIHQLRGRVGRSDRKGYCYLLFKKDKIKEDAAKRLKTIVDYSHLGAGFELAVKDLEIRGGGDILGIRQSGQGQEVGINLFLEMLENKIDELKEKGNIKFDNEEVKTRKNNINTSVELNIGAYIDDKYFDSELDKINFYREIESLEDVGDLENLVSDFKEINKDLPDETINFFDLLRIKLKAPEYKILSIKRVGINYQIDFTESTKLEELKEFLKLDKEVKFVVNSLTRLRSPVKNFANEKIFLEYLLQLFYNKLSKRKIIKKKL